MYTYKTYEKTFTGTPADGVPTEFVVRVTVRRSESDVDAFVVRVLLLDGNQIATNQVGTLAKFSDEKIIDESVRTFARDLKYTRI